VQDESFISWLEALERRHLADLTFPEVRRAVQALSSIYVERRDRISRSEALSSAGKRAAFAMYFAPLHYLLVSGIVRALKATVPKHGAILDLGCGTGTAGVAWAVESQIRPHIIGVDRNSWVLQECKNTYAQFGVQGTVKHAELRSLRIPPNSAVIAAFTINELDAQTRDRFRREFTKVAEAGMPVLIVEPIARRAISWWDDWSSEWTASGGRDDEWRLRVELPPPLALMDKAAGLNHRELTGRSLWLPG
jgi:hypothetical protein